MHGPTSEPKPHLGEADFEARISADRQQMRAYYDSLGKDDDAAGLANPAHRMASEYYRIYLEGRPSLVANRALQRALELWGQIRGSSGDAREAVRQIAPEEDVWSAEAIDGYLDSLWKDHGFDAALAELEQVAGRVLPDRSRAEILHILCRRWMDAGALAKARDSSKEILRLDTSTSPWYVEFSARGCLYEIECLNVGQPAPDFALPDIDGNLVELERYRGRVVLLSFWAAWCGACPREFPHLRALATAYDKRVFAILGAALDEDLVALRETVQREQLDWPHICGGTCWHDPLSRLYNNRGIPDIYLIDAKGHIAAKGTPAEEVGRIIDRLLQGP